MLPAFCSLLYQFRAFPCLLAPVLLTPDSHCVFLLILPHPLRTGIHRSGSLTDLCGAFPHPREREQAQLGWGSGVAGAISSFSRTLRTPAMRILSQCDRALHFLFHRFPGLLHLSINWVPVSNSSHSILPSHPTALRVNFINIKVDHVTSRTPR